MQGAEGAGDLRGVKAGRLLQVLSSAFCEQIYWAC